MLLRLPVLQLREFRIRFPFLFPMSLRPGGEHYWELGRKGFPVRRFREVIADAGFNIELEKSPKTNYSHRCFTLEKGTQR